MLFFSKCLALEVTKDTLIHASGQNIGIKINDGLVVKKLYEVNNKKPWLGILKENDKIISLNNKFVYTINDLHEVLNKSNGFIDIVYERNSLVYKDKIEIINYNNKKSLGLLVKDGVLGVGTLTYVIENTFGALGHQITFEDIKNGDVFKSNVKSIKKSKKNEIGEKNAEVMDEKIGDVTKNTTTGVYGNIKDYQYKEYKIGFKEDVKKGSAKILTVIRDDLIEEFDVEIIDFSNQENKSTKSMKIKITDDSLIEKTGGIVQGMSGSPIIQDNKIIGALTHVVVENPKIGYGIYIEWMLEDNGIDVKK